jgi:DNA-binding transcriptional LysR family regulator
MTLKQLKYAITVAETGNITEAAKRLFIAQPSLTSAIMELEKEFEITIFNRTRKGIEITIDGEEFLGYARQVLEQANLIEERYTGTTLSKPRFCVSSQHYSFVVEAFVELLKSFEGSKYEFHLRETQTYDIIEDVSRHRS